MAETPITPTNTGAWAFFELSVRPEFRCSQPIRRFRSQAIGFKPVIPFLAVLALGRQRAETTRLTRPKGQETAFWRHLGSFSSGPASHLDPPARLYTRSQIGSSEQAPDAIFRKVPTSLREERAALWDSVALRPSRVR